MLQVANFKYIDEAATKAEEEVPTTPLEDKTATNNSEKANFWEELLRDRYEVHKVEEFNTMGKGKRSRKQVCFFQSIYGHLFFQIFNTSPELQLKNKLPNRI